jgi:phosphate:Na+ symporter
LEDRKAAVKTGLFHLLFNVFTILLGMIFLSYFTQLVLAISRNASPEQTIANAHMLFNGLGVLIMIPFIGHYERLLNFIVPPRKKANSKGG